MQLNTTAHDILADLHAKLDKSKRTGDKLMARCPAHDDKNPSLSVTIGDNGDRVVLICRDRVPDRRGPRRAQRGGVLDDARPVRHG